MISRMSAPAAALLGLAALLAGAATADAACADFWTRIGAVAPEGLCNTIDSSNAKGALPLVLGKEGCKASGAAASCLLWSFPVPVSEFAAILSFDAKGTYALVPIRTEGVTDENSALTDQLLGLAQDTYGDQFPGFPDLAPGDWLITDAAKVDPQDPFQSLLAEKNPWIRRQLDQGYSMVFVVRGD